MLSHNALINVNSVDMAVVFSQVHYDTVPWAKTFFALVGTKTLGMAKIS